MLFRSWTMKKGFFGEDFTAQVKNPNTILCTTLKGSEQSVSMKNFRLVYDDWEGYLSGNVKRKDWIPHTRFSKYTISIIHQYLK